MKELSNRDWQRRYAEQAGWTKPLRDYLFQQIQDARIERILDVGCGPATLTAEIRLRTGGWVCGLDRSAPVVNLAHASDPGSSFTVGDGLELPFRSMGFDLTCCHFFLLWAADPAQALAEMVRVTRRGGIVMAIAEPDYSARIDFPSNLVELGRLQAGALSAQGADIQAGRKLAGWFNAAGLSEIQTGVLGGQWQPGRPAASLASEWEILKADLAETLEPSTLSALREADEAAWKDGSRVLFIPTFYAWGKVTGCIDRSFPPD